MTADSSRAGGSHRQFDVLVVCTANICRSPMVEGLLRARLDQAEGSWSVSSAGTHADDGRPVHPRTVQALFDHDLALPENWRSRALTVEQIELADLVLTATREHRSDVVRTDPRASGRTFTVRQFVRLLRTPGVDDSEHVSGHPGERLLDTALAARGFGPPAIPAADDIADPIGHPYRVFRALADDLELELRAFTGLPESTRPSAPTLRPVPTPGRLSRWASRSA
jgi:protein-tyrosine phosphatase